MAAGKSFTRQLCYGKGELEFAGSFAPNGASSPVASTIKGGLVASVVLSSTGLWLVTLSVGAKDVIALSADAQIGSAGNINTSIQIGVVAIASPVTFQIRNNPAGSVANIAANAADRICFSGILQIGAIR